ncbi:hypothetical protein TD95_003205 [Thielaviopsis punctulata]|uniref:N-acetyltransferase domain-containing protein n=1 Tax=Thielaviopsis punctulata TaxID=72032 RepID=A0A0F4ZA27_9PEZI|nr:hypothetical protein TD95_003205 [Thielaviopsis punctulata]
MHVFSDIDFPYPVGIRPLTTGDVDACEIVENNAFEKTPEFRATREKFEYRLKFYPELCYGLFIKVKPNDTVFGKTLPMQAVDKQADASDQWFMVGHAVSTRSNNPVISDEDMSVPVGWRDEGTKPREGFMTGIHSVALLQAVQRKGLCRLLLTHYLDEMKKRDDIKVVSLLCQDYLVDAYASMGFSKVEGESLATFGGGGWNDMITKVDS